MARVLPITIDLPDGHLYAIGLVVVFYARLEHGLADVIQQLLGIGPKHARLAISRGRLNSQVEKIQHLMTLEGIKPAADLDMLGKALEKVERRRNLVAHGQWLHGPDGGVWLQDVTGSWRPDPKRPKVPRQVMPEGINVTEAWLMSLLEDIVECAKPIGELFSQVQAHKAAKLGKTAKD